MDDSVAHRSRNRTISFSMDEENLSVNDRQNLDGAIVRHKEKTRPVRNLAEVTACKPVNKGDLIDVNYSEKLPSKLTKNYLGKSAKSLNLRKNRIVEVTTLSNKSRRYMHISSSTRSTAVDLKLTIEMNLSNLLELDLSQNRLQSFLSEEVVALLPSLKVLYMNDNRIKTICSSSLKRLSEFGSLEELNLGTNVLEQLPPEIGFLTTLRKLKLSNNKLVELPKEIVKLVHLYDSVKSLSIGGNNLISPQQSIAEVGGLSFIKCHFQMLNDESTLEPSDRYLYNLYLEHTAVSQRDIKDLKNKNKGGGAASAAGKVSKRVSLQMKLLVVGHERAGKTSLIAKLRGNLHNSKTECETVSTQLDSAENALDIGQFVDTEASCSTPFGSTKERSRPFVNPPSFGQVGGDAPSSSGSRSTSPIPCSTAASVSVYDLEHESTVGFEISNWFPKKNALDKFLRPKSSDEATTKADKAAKTLFAVRPEDIKYVIWDFAGQSVYHAVHEMFLSPFALHLLVFDISKTCTERDCDVYVQYWIDLIQARAPGSSIVIVATHADLLTSEETNQRIAMVQARNASNEALRLADLHRDVAYCDNEEKKATFRSLLVKRPKIDKEIIALRKSTAKNDHAHMMLLSCRIAQLSTPSKEVPHPFGVINIEVPDFYQQVKDVLMELRRDPGRHFCTMEELEAIIIAKADKANNAACRAEGSVCNGSGAKHKNLFKETTMAVMHWSNVGEVLWFNIKNGTDPLAHVLNGEGLTVLSRSSTDSHIGGDTSAQHASDFIFLDPDWLVNCIKLILNHKLIEEIATYEKLLLINDSESKRQMHNFLASKLIAKRGIIKWGFIKQYLGEKCDAKVVDVIRVVMEKFNVIIPVRSAEVSLTRSQSASFLPTIVHSETAAFQAHKILFTPERARPTRTVSHNQTSLLGQSLAASASTPHLDTTTAHLDAFFSLNSPPDDQHYLIPTFLPPYDHEVSAIAVQSGFITLERTFHFNRFTPPGIIQTIFALSYRFDEQSILPVSPQESPHAPDCWDRAFMQVHKPVRIVVELIGNDTESTSLKRPPSRGGTTPTSDSNIAAAAEPAELKEHDFSSQLRIRGMGHMLNAHLILYQLDKYTKATRRVLDAFPGLGHVRLSSTCPECMINQSDEGKRGEFRHSELVGLQETFKKVSDSLNQARIGNATAEQHSELRQWNNKRHTCPRNRCQIKSDMLIFIPKRLKAEIEQTCQSEKEINFLLDEAVRASSVPSENISSSVVKVMAANGLDSMVNKLTAHFKDPMNRNSPYFDQESISLAITPLDVSSGVVVMPPPPKIFELGPDTCPAPLVLACEHVMTDVNPVDGKFQFARKGAEKGVKTVFFIGNATHWLYLAELIFQGSSYPGSDTNFWDMCALRIVAPIEPLLQRNLEPDESIYPEIVLDIPVILSSSHPSTPHIVTTEHEEEEPIVLYPFSPAPPIRAMKVSTKKVAVDQVVSLLGFPGNKDLAVDCGRVEQNDPNGDILINLLSADGSSGGPVVDRDGHLIGLLSRSHECIKYSCVQPLRNLFDIIRTLS